MRARSRCRDARSQRKRIAATNKSINSTKTSRGGHVEPQAGRGPAHLSIHRLRTAPRSRRRATKRCDRGRSSASRTRLLANPASRDAEITRWSGPRRAGLTRHRTRRLVAAVQKALPYPRCEARLVRLVGVAVGEPTRRWRIADGRCARLRRHARRERRGRGRARLLRRRERLAGEVPLVANTLTTAPQQGAHHHRTEEPNDHAASLLLRSCLRERRSSRPADWFAWKPRFHRTSTAFAKFALVWNPAPR